MQFNGIKYIHNVVQLSPPSISKTFSSSQTESVYLLTNNFSFPLPTALGLLCSIFCLYEFVYSRYHIEMESEHLSFCD